MPICPYCGATVPDGAIACGKCGGSLVSLSLRRLLPFSLKQIHLVNLQILVPLHGQAETLILNCRVRLEKALKRNEQLSYIAVGLSVVLLVLVIHFLILENNGKSLNGWRNEKWKIP